MTKYDLSQRLQTLGITQTALAHRLGYTRRAVAFAMANDSVMYVVLVEALERMPATILADWLSIARVR